MAADPLQQLGTSGRPESDTLEEERPGGALTPPAVADTDWSSDDMANCSPMGAPRFKAGDCVETIRENGEGTGATGQVVHGTGDRHKNMGIRVRWHSTGRATDVAPLSLRKCCGSKCVGNVCVLPEGHDGHHRGIPSVDKWTGRTDALEWPA